MIVIYLHLMYNIIYIKVFNQNLRFIAYNYVIHMSGGILEIEN